MEGRTHGWVRNPICINQFINLALIVLHNRTNRRRYDSESDKQFIWAKFPSGLIFPYWVRWFFGAGTEVQLVLLVVGRERRLLSLCPAGVVVTVAPVDIAKLIYFCLF